MTKHFFFQTENFLEFKKSSAYDLNTMEDLAEWSIITAKLLAVHDWFMTGSFQPNFIYLFIDLIKKEPNKIAVEEELSKIFYAYFSANNWHQLDDMVDGWSRSLRFQSRITIFKDCINIIKSTPQKTTTANVLIPTLLAQLEGIIIEYLINYREYKFDEIRGFKNKKKKLTEIWEKHQDTRFKGGKGYLTPTFNFSFDTAAEMLINLIYKDFDPEYSSEEFFSLNRHRILHGNITNYGIFDNVLRSFLILDFIRYLP